MNNKTWTEQQKIGLMSRLQDVTGEIILCASCLLEPKTEKVEDDFDYKTELNKNLKSLTETVQKIIELSDVIIQQSKNSSNNPHQEKFCVWIEDDYSNWHTECSRSFIFIHDGPIENGMKFCPFCARNLVID